MTENPDEKRDPVLVAIDRGCNAVLNELRAQRQYMELQFGRVDQKLDRVLELLTTPPRRPVRKKR